MCSRITDIEKVMRVANTPTLAAIDVKHKRNKKNSKKKKGSKHHLVADSGGNLASGDTPVRPKKPKKRKHSNQIESAQEEVNGHHGVSLNKKKKVTWGENTTNIIPEPAATTETGNLNGSSKLQTASESFLALLSEIDSTREKPKIPKSNEKNLAEIEKRASRRARKLEKRARDKLAKALRKNSQESKVLAMESIEDRNIQNRKLKNKSVKLVGSQEKVDAKRPRLDGKNAIVPAKKQIQPISPNREVVAGYKFKDLSEKQKEAFIRLKEQKRYDKLSTPKIQLHNYANSSSMVLDIDERTPLTLGDVQHFLIYTIQGHFSTGNLPTWIKLENSAKLAKRVCIVVDGVSLTDYVNNEDDLPNLNSFKYKLDVITPYAYGGDFLTEFFQVPLTNHQRDKLLKRYGSFRGAEIAGEAFKTLQRLYPAGTFLPRKEKKKDLIDSSQENADSQPKTTFSDPNVLIFPPSEDRFPRTELLLRSWDLIKERIPVPFAEGLRAQKYQGFVQSKDNYDEVTDESPIWALDCEMCMTRAGQELTRISVINENFEVVYETMVKPYNPIINYLTQYSGITKRDLENVWTRIEDVHEDLRNLFPSDVILAGHSIGCDLLAMKMFHPYIIDTSCIFNLSGVRPQKTKLKTLMAELLYERIQEGGHHGHDSVEDAASCLKLIKAKLMRSIEWGDAVLAGKRKEEESVAAQQMLLRRDKEGREPTIYPVAANSIIRCGPRAHQTSVQQGPHVTQNEERRDEWHNSKPVPVVRMRDDNPFGTSVYTKPIFKHLFARGTGNVLLVGDEKFVSTGKELKPKLKGRLVESQLLFSIQRNSDVVQYGCENAPNNGMSLLRLSPDEELDPKTRIVQADKLIGEALNALKRSNSIVTILLTGRHPDDSDLLVDHGLLMTKILKPAYVPLTIEDISCS